MRWFRKRKDEGRDAPAEAAPVPEPPARPASPKDGESAAEAQVRPRRRRGSRGGRGRKKKTVEAGAEAAESTEKSKEEAARPAKSRPAKKEAARPRQRTRRREPKRSELPPVAKELYISVEVGEQRVALLEEGKVAEVYLERRGRRSIAGNVYKGVVDNVLPGMEASFVDIGLAKNGFLYVDEIVIPELEGKQRGRKIQDLIQRGEQVLVQAVKDPMGTKGARLTTEVSLPGRFLVYVPVRRGDRHLAAPRGRRARAAEGDLEGARAARGRHHRPHGGRRRVEGGARGRPGVPPEALGDDQGPIRPDEGAGARLPGGRAAASDHSRPHEP